MNHGILSKAFEALKALRNQRKLVEYAFDELKKKVEITVKAVYSKRKRARHAKNKKLAHGQ